MTTKIKVGDLTLRQVKEILNRHCTWDCRECLVKHNADYVLCKLSIEYDLGLDFTDNMLEQEVIINE